MTNKFDTVISILTSDKHDLKSLAEQSGRDPFRFYNGADLTGLNLSNQDLTGLNFDRADIRFCNIDDIIFDAGSFNLSITDNEQNNIKDIYEFNYNEVMSFPYEELMAFAEFRPGTIDSLIGSFGITYQRFAELAGISTSSLRKSRNGKIVAMETARYIFSALDIYLSQVKIDGENFYRNIMENPCVALLIDGHGSNFKYASHNKINKLLEIRRRRIAYMRAKNPDSKTGDYIEYRDTSEYLQYYEYLLSDSDYD